MIAAIALVDLDDTLFQTRRKCPDGLGDDALTAMAVDVAGAPIGFATPTQAAFHGWLAATTLLVPVTGRSLGALRRTTLRYDYAVAAHGGVLVRPGDRLCDTWASRMANGSNQSQVALLRLTSRTIETADRLGIGVRARVISEGDMPLYVVVKHALPEGNDAELHAVAAAVAAEVPSGWTTHINGNNVAYLPPHVGKAAAVEPLLLELRDRHPALPVVGVGDSLSDQPFMRLCDFMMMPSRSQLAQAFR